MNIFATYKDPHLSARMLDDVRAQKMIVESGQILATALHLRGLRLPRPFPQPTHAGHPAVHWAGRRRGNYAWLWRHMRALLDRYRLYRGKPHAYEWLMPVLRALAVFIPEGAKARNPNCTPHKELPVYEAYRVTLLEKWGNDVIRLTWDGRPHVFTCWAEVEAARLKPAQDAAA